MRNYFILIIVILTITGCSPQKDSLIEIADYGGFISFEEMPATSFNILSLDSETLEGTLYDPNENAVSYRLKAKVGDNEAIVMEVNSFPQDVQLNVGEILDALEIDQDRLDLGTNIALIGEVTTEDGTVYTGLAPDFNNDNVNEGGDTTNRAKDYFPAQAMEFYINFFQPPGLKIRGTSFEEVSVSNNEQTYEKSGDPNEDEDLVNGAQPPFVNYEAQGDSGDDEIGFNSKYFAVTDISSSSLGFSAERIGVYSLMEDYDAYPDGTKGFHMEDVDGMIQITFDTVDIPDDVNKSGISFEVFFGNTSWESKDGMYAYVNITTDSGNEVIEMVNLFDDDVEAIAGQWYKFDTGFLTNVRSYQLVIEGYNGATPESIDIDNVVVYEPE
ncbi:hypothetical protein SAMN04488033_1398 [Salegentibacter agarivorans]|uniref:Uncharacterized protein n=1 Tax=Salegentibacter agarivorans TaxID=345907 RepID=A0A1I2Q5Y8_9FLAO|nr:hypothetical protein SAMN04488033_1398 [Salegentibacter agarivorans]